MFLICFGNMKYKKKNIYIYICVYNMFWKYEIYKKILICLNYVLFLFGTYYLLTGTLTTLKILFANRNLNHKLIYRD